MTPITQRDDDDQPYFQTKPMSPFTRALFGLGVAHMRSVEATVTERPIGHMAETDAGYLRQLRMDSLVGTPDAIKECRKRKAQAQAAALCNASSVPAFLEAVDFLTDALEQIDRDGYCLECGKVLVAETKCVRCGREHAMTEEEGDE